MELWLSHTDEVQCVVAAVNSPAMTDLLCIAVCWHRFRVIKLVSGHAVRSTLLSAVKNVLRKKWCMCYIGQVATSLSLTPYLTSPQRGCEDNRCALCHESSSSPHFPFVCCSSVSSNHLNRGRRVGQCCTGGPLSVFTALSSLFLFERLWLYFQQSPLACLYHYSLILSSSELFRGWFKELRSRRVFSFLTLTQNNHQGLTACLSPCSLLFCLQYFKTYSLIYLVLS